jgi:hypothetical protein
MDSSQPRASADDAVKAVRAASALSVALATLFVTDPDASPAGLESLLARTLDRLQVLARSQRVVDLIEHPLLGRECLVHVTPCLVLDTGSRRVRIPGDPELLDGAMLEAAFARR